MALFIFILIKMFAQTKYKKRHNEQLRRETAIQNYMINNDWSRVRAVHQFDYDKEMKRQNIGSKL